MEGTKHHQPRTRMTRRTAWMIGMAAALTAAWMVVPSGRLVVVGAMLVGGVVRVLQPARAAPGDPPTLVARGQATDDGIHLLVESGMRELTHYLQRHAAFAAYLEQRSAGDATPEDDRRGQKHA